jgi:hypothetical protein
MAKVIHIHLEEFGGGVHACLQWNICNPDEVLDRVMWQRDGMVHKVLCEVPGGFSDCAKQAWTLDPPHLHRSWDYQPDWFPCLLREYISKVEAVILVYHQAPESITDVQFAEQDV